MRSNRAVVLFICLFILTISSSFIGRTEIVATERYNISEMSKESLSDMKILAVIANGFGDSYFWIKNQFESWGCNVTTAGLTSVVASCPNQPPNPVDADILISDVNSDILSQFDAVYVPAGPHWVILEFSTVTHDMLENAYNAGLVVSAICIGQVALAQISNIVGGVKVAYYSQTFDDMLNAGAIITYSGVVSDKRVVTAGSGTYQSTNQATYPFCVAIAKEVLGLSAVAQTTITSTKGETNTTYTISVETVNLNDTFYGNTTMDIHSLEAYVYHEDSGEDYDYVYLTDIDEDNIYVGNYTGTVKGDYYIDLEVKSVGWGLESIRNAIDFKLKALPGFELWVIPIVLPFIFLLRKIKKN